MMKKIVIGIVAHVDAGKTTLSEALLYKSGNIRELGRVDKQNSFLDNNQIERERGITIFSKQAEMIWGNTQITLLDTPGHIDFSTEMERTLQVLDYAVLVISGADGVQGHTLTLWHLLEHYQIPVFLFVNKMDQDGTNEHKLLTELKECLDENCVCFNKDTSEEFYEAVAMCEEEACEQFLENGEIEKKKIKTMIAQRKLFPCIFGSALKLNKIDTLLEYMDKYTISRNYLKEFGAKVFKITRDENKNRLTHLKITGGALKVKELLGEEKVNQIRIYSGEKYTTVNEALAGSICAVTGLAKSYAGEGFGIEQESSKTILEPVLTYQIKLEQTSDAATILPKLRQLEEEDPKLHIIWNEQLQEIQAQVMGEVQIEILKRVIEERYGEKVEFGTGNIVYKETIAAAVEGVGHYEPLRHYAEVHLLLEPSERGTGITISSDCSEDLLDRNWQRLILTHIAEREHKGVLTGGAITDIKITLKSGRAHLKHTEGGDFRQAVYRAIRQGLMQAKTILLEPYYTYRLELPRELLGKAMSDIEQMQGTFETTQNETAMVVLEGNAPVITMRDYQKEVTSYSKGNGKLFCTLQGYKPCHNTEEIVANSSYDALKDKENPSGSIFCAHGAGFYVPWDEVKDSMHLPSCIKEQTEEKTQIRKTGVAENWITLEEIELILEKSVNANKKEKNKLYQRSKEAKERMTAPVFKTAIKRSDEKYLLVDGYNIIFAWEELKELAKENIDGARGRLMDILCNYQAIKKYNLILVFDAYRVQGHQTEIMDYHNIHIVYTKEAETADQYIEKFAHENGRKYNVTVATSDGLEQIIIRGQGCYLISARELEEEVKRANTEIMELAQKLLIK